jgi:hypothetical protein
LRELADANSRLEEQTAALREELAHRPRLEAALLGHHGRGERLGVHDRPLGTDLGRQRSNKALADALSCREGTVEAHVTQLLRGFSKGGDCDRRRLAYGR